MNGRANRHFARGLAAALAFAGLASLAGCGGGDMRDLHAWVAQVKARPGPKIKPIPELAPYRAYTYPETDLRSPFVPIAAPKVSNVHPNLHRKKEYLERFPLDSLKFVGEIKFGGTTYALIEDPQGIVHRVHAGQYLGQNNGLVTTIFADEIKLTEIVPNGTGGYQRRIASLSLAQDTGG